MNTNTGTAAKTMFRDLTGKTGEIPDQVLERLLQIEDEKLDQAAKVITIDACRYAIRSMALTVYRPDSCLVMTKIVSSLLTAAGVPNRVQPVNAIGINSGILYIGANLRPADPVKPKIVLLGSYDPNGVSLTNDIARIITNDPQANMFRKYRGRPYQGGHIVNIAYVNGDPILIDWSIDQMSDPDRGMYLDPFMSRLPYDLSSGPVAIHTTPQLPGADPGMGTTLLYEAVADTTYLTSPAWNGSDPAIPPLVSAALGYYSAAYIGGMRGILRVGEKGGPSLSDTSAQPVSPEGGLLDPALQPIRYLRSGEWDSPAAFQPGGFVTDVLTEVFSRLSSD